MKFVTVPLWLPAPALVAKGPEPDPDVFVVFPAPWSGGVPVAVAMSNPTEPDELLFPMLGIVTFVPAEPFTFAFAFHPAALELDDEDVDEPHPGGKGKGAPPTRADGHHVAVMDAALFASGVSIPWTWSEAYFYIGIGCALGRVCTPWLWLTHASGFPIPSPVDDLLGVPCRFTSGPPVAVPVLVVAPRSYCDCASPPPRPGSKCTRESIFRCCASQRRSSSNSVQ